MMTTRDSSHDAIAELRTLRLARVRERARAEAEREQQAHTERAEQQRSARAEPPETSAAQRKAAPAASAPRTTRTTVERIAALRIELSERTAERLQAARARAERVDALHARLMARRSHWGPIATGLLVAGAVFGALLARLPDAALVEPALVRGALPTAPAAPHDEPQLGPGVVTDPAGGAAPEVALRATSSGPARPGDAGMPTQSEAAAAPLHTPDEPVVARKRRPARRATASQSKSTRAPVERPALDALGNLAGCGDDPICGLGL